MIDFEHNYKPDSSINYDLVDACHQLLQQCYALMEAIAAWIDFLNNPEEQHSPYGDIYPTQELLEGLSRLGISAKKEAQFLEGLLRNGNIQPFHLNGSNLPYLEAVYRCARQENGLVTIFKTVKYIVPVESFDDNKEVVQKYKVEKYRVDVISCHGEKWIKVSARNVRWLYSQDFMVDATIPNDAMENDPLGVSVEEISPLVSNEISRSINWRYDPSKAATSTLNLDITTLLALASQLTHNGQASELNLESQRKANNSIKVQLQQEKDRPIMPLLAHYLFGRTLTTTQSCYNKFISIVNTLAGPLEALRARIFFEPTITIPFSSSTIWKGGPTTHLRMEVPCWN
ncbi:hypothetical protein L0F63_000356 [Massospora cicadina]|nr:hypothetical protein L0F63_000356 [Massospora cicadina]